MGLSKPIMEINPKHIIIESLNERFNKDKNDKTIKDILNLIFESACLSSGFTLEDPILFTKRINRMVELGLDCESNNDLTEEEDSSNIKEEELNEDESKMEEVD